MPQTDNKSSKTVRVEMEKEGGKRKKKQIRSTNWSRVLPLLVIRDTCLKNKAPDALTRRIRRREGKKGKKSLTYYYYCPNPSSLKGA